MPRKPREDEPGDILHVMNRGLCQRDIYQEEEDYRYFLSRVARCVRWGLIEVLAYVLMTNHFHLLVRSLTGEIARALMIIQGQYTRRFNRRRGDGPLFRGRYVAKRVRSEAGRYVVFHYIQGNPDAARLPDDALPRMYCSARDFGRARRRIWLSPAVREEVEEIAARHGLVTSPGSELLTPGQVRLVEARLASPSDDFDALDLLLDAAGASDARTAAWFRERARLADQTEPGVPVVDATSILDVVAMEIEATPRWICQPTKRNARSAWPVVEIALLRDLGGRSYVEIARLRGTSRSTVHERYRSHAACLAADEAYAHRFSALVARCVEVCHRGG